MVQYPPPLSATVLIVENEAIIRIELAAQLVDMGLRVLVACDADEAISLLDAHREIGLLLTDVLMPGSMDGVRLAHHVRNRWPPIKIVATSGRPGLRVGDLPSGSTFFPKPYSPATVRKAIAPLLKQNSALQAA
jgi:CheY-like chemotaxis protein